ncbi:MAG: transcriptional repressor LexA [Methylococcaceae bacterium]|nr:transcriptional repressor LexA [Methylococcaceae bacterium]
MKHLTARQQQLLQFLKDYSAREGFPPTIAEITRALQVRSPHGIREQLQALARKGAIELIPNAARGIRILLEAPPDADALPIIGRVAAGQPILALPHVIGHCRIEPALFKGRPDYLLEVRGMSMRDAGILDGDLLAVRRTPEARSGQIVVARLHDEVTVKTLRLQGSSLWLEPANPEFSPISVDPERDDFCIEGVMAGLIRHRAPPP